MIELLFKGSLNLWAQVGEELGYLYLMLKFLHRDVCFLVIHQYLDFLVVDLNKQN